MNRAIKFRGKSFDSGKWIYGFYSERNGKSYIQMDGEVILTPVDPATVGQLTGLKDKNEREIYEGDILRSDNGYSEPIGWSEENAAFSTMDFSDGEYTYEIDKSLAATKTVSGNIHDNPEPLETE